MKNISKLLEKEKWEIKSLGDIIIEIFSGNGVTEEQLGTGNCPSIKNKDLGKLPKQFVECRSFINPDLIKKKKYCKCGDLLISSMGGIKDVGKGCVYLGDQQCIIGNDVIAIRHNENPKFLSYIISTADYKKQINKIKTGTTVYHLSPSKIKKIKIPLPPRHIQDLIADYLDHWTNLEQELADRKKQYKHYKECILTNEKDKWEIKTISEIVTEMYEGSEISKTQINTGEYPAIRCGDLNSRLKEQFTRCVNFVDPKLIKNPRFIKNQDVLISQLGDSKTIGTSSVYLGKENCMIGRNVMVVRSKNDSKYISYALSSIDCKKQIFMYSQTSTALYLCINDIRKLRISIPPLEEQKRIVSKLDKFRTITEDLEEGIPKLLEQTRQQYEFYKEEILKFE